MIIPNADRAIIEPAKLCDYLLNVSHRRGGSKARLLLSLGYTVQNWAQLERDLRLQHLTMEVDRISNSSYGVRYEIVALLRSPSGRAVTLLSEAFGRLILVRMCPV